MNTSNMNIWPRLLQLADIPELPAIPASGEGVGVLHGARANHWQEEVMNISESCVVFTLACFVVCAHLTFAATLPSSSSSSSNDLEHLDTEISFQNQAQPLKRVKRKFSHGALGCRGVFHKAIFHKLDRLCDDCYEIYKIPEIHQLCRSDCFSSQYFKSCVNALMLKEKDEIYQEMVSILG